jgi:hypothetical protein
MASKLEILDRFSLLSIPSGGISSWLTTNSPDDVFARLGKIDEEPLSAVQLNQLLVLGREAPISDGFFRYYWVQNPPDHPYDVSTLPEFSVDYLESAGNIVSLGHLKWGLYRLYVDALLYFGNVRTAFRRLRDWDEGALQAFYRAKRFDRERIQRRGPPLPLRPIPKDIRYLISEMACKSYGDNPQEAGDLKDALMQSFKVHSERGSSSPTVRQLLSDQVPDAQRSRQHEFLFSADEVLDETVASEADLSLKYQGIAKKFSEAREAALDNTRLYLSMLSDLDVYVATSMRSRKDFREMSDFCERIFQDPKLANLNLRYFDPTMSAAHGHEDKGLIECLMVKCAKVLVYHAGDRESYGKDAEAAMALSLGKPVIFYCDQEQRRRFFQDVHPLARLIEFETGVAVGAMVTSRPEDVVDILHRTFENRMVHYLEQSKSGFLRLREKITASVVRLQTGDQLLTEAFWNHYHRRAKETQGAIRSID